MFKLPMHRVEQHAEQSSMQKEDLAIRTRVCCLSMSPPYGTGSRAAESSGVDDYHDGMATRRDTHEQWIRVEDLPTGACILP